ncbi:hypothetical protein SK128_025745, partial [Halocaridina rubra]
VERETAKQSSGCVLWKGVTPPPRILGGGIEIQERIRRKRVAKKIWDSHGDEESRQEYKEMQGKTKREVVKAEEKAYDELHEKKATMEGKNGLVPISKTEERAGKAVYQVRLI